MAQDLRSFIEFVADQHPQHLARATAPVNPNRFEVTALLQRMQQRGEQKMALFEHVVDVEERPSQFPLVFNVFASRPLCALALGLPPDQWKMGLSQAFAERERRPGHVAQVSAREALCKEVVLKGEDVDLRRLPIPMHHALDVGPYLTMACVMKALSGDFYDVTFTKNLLKGPRRMSLSAHAHHHLDAIVGEHERAGRRAPCAVILGHHPALYLASCALSPYGNDDYRTIAGFFDEPLRLVPSETWGEEFLVPADAEIIIEGEVPPGVRETQNPFGEIAGYYQWEMLMPVLEVTAMTHRRGGIMQGIFPGHPEHWHLGGIPKEGSVFNSIRRNIPGVTAVHLPMSGCSRFTCYISLKKEFDNEPRKAAMQAFCDMPNLKFAVVVDEDVDVFNEQDVLWALVTRTWWDRDLTVVDKVQSFRDWLGGAVAIVDATRPKDREFPPKNEIPADVLARMDPDQYLR
ncbi:MAG: UbiD family decarboxylase [Deltaproteobacteria bacterium]|nr:UbiD family decarboxylase [Deltaproteobacteria bacterium]MBI3079561.1 UbiD family decarboxylase [Deltaproteobacteria bacterium]